MDIEILYKKFFIISKYCLISNSNENTIITDMNNVESSTDSDSRNKKYNINNNNNNRNNMKNNNNISDREDHKILSDSQFKP